MIKFFFAVVMMIECAIVLIYMITQDPEKTGTGFWVLMIAISITLVAFFITHLLELKNLNKEIDKDFFN